MGSALRISDRPGITLCSLSVGSRTDFEAMNRRSHCIDYTRAAHGAGTIASTQMVVDSCIGPTASKSA